MKKSSFDSILSFLLGASWAFIIFGAWIVFKTTIIFGLASALFFTMLTIFTGLFMILVLETLSLYKERHAELKKQTQLLEAILEKTNA